MILSLLEFNLRINDHFEYFSKALVSKAVTQMNLILYSSNIFNVYPQIVGTGQSDSDQWRQVK